jgi:CheY-like chemotaxis protein
MWYNGATMDRMAFVKCVEAALENLYDCTCLSDNPLGSCLSTKDGTPLPPDRLQRILVQAIDELRTPVGTPASSAGWRRYRYLELRYLNGLSHKVVAGELALSLRQAHRVRTEAVNVVAGRLWQKYVDTSRALDRAGDEQITRSKVWPGDLPRPRTTLDEELARLDAEPVDVPTDLVKEIRGVVEVMQPLASQYDVYVQVDASMESQIVAVGRAVLRQVLVLLAMCALERQKNGRLVIAAGTSADKLLVDIAFTPSVSESSETLFQPDSRLATARRLIEAQGGTLDALIVEDRVCYRLTLPPSKIDTVLTIDDNPDLARLFDTYLQGTRYQVIRAKTGQGALRLAEKYRPDVVTLDVMMPFEDGWEIFRQLRENPRTKSIPIVVCSILPEKELALALGATDFLAKPVTRQSLIATLDRCLCS